MEKYSSINETREHRIRVINLMEYMANTIAIRSLKHDSSKMEEPELEIFDKYTPKLKNCKYGSEEYKSYLTAMKPALDNHYANNRHHPEHFEDGISGMDLIDLIEMFCDWKAASERHSDGDIYKSIDLNKKRFNMSDQLVSIFKNTVYNYCEKDDVE